MHTTHRRLLTTLATLGLAAALAASAAAAPHADKAGIPVVRVTLGHQGPRIHGPARWRAGAVRISVSTTVPDQELTLLQFKPGYSYTRFLRDGARANSRTRSAATAMRRVFAGTDFLGGADVFPGTPASFTVDLEPGTYYLGEMSGRPTFRRITVTGSKPATPSAAHVPVLTAYDHGFHVNQATLPAKGTITIRNIGRQIHRLNLLPVKPGTTRAQLGAYLRKTGGRPDGAPPSFAGRGPQLGTSMISPGNSFQLSYGLPAGTYAVLSFQPDSHTGKPQTLDGLYTVVTLR
jgi:hypothetical protein